MIQRASLGNKEQSVGSLEDLERLLEASEFGQQIQLHLIRQGQSLEPLTIKLIPRPLEIMRPEMGGQPLADFESGLHDPFSLLLTLNRIDDEKKLPGERAIVGAELRDVQWNVTHQDPLAV